MTSPPPFRANHMLLVKMSGHRYTDSTFWCTASRYLHWWVVPNDPLRDFPEKKNPQWDFRTGGTLHLTPHGDETYDRGRVVRCRESAVNHIWGEGWEDAARERGGDGGGWGPPGQGLPYCPRCFYRVYPEGYLSMVSYRSAEGEDRWNVPVRYDMRRDPDTYDEGHPPGWFEVEDSNQPIFPGQTVPRVRHLIMFVEQGSADEKTPNLGNHSQTWHQDDVVCSECFFQAFPEYTLPLKSFQQGVRGWR